MNQRQKDLSFASVAIEVEDTFCLQITFQPYTVYIYIYIYIYMTGSGVHPFQISQSLYVFN